jgi:hypothetical protein
MDVTVGWCSEFEPGWRVGHLLRASRPPALFQYHFGRYLAAAGVPLTGRAILDEDLGDGGLSRDAAAAIATSDIVFLASHGRMDGLTYRFRLRRGEWTPANSPPPNGPSVLVLDTCNVASLGAMPGESSWVQPGCPSPAIVLGFVGPATDGYSESMRGRAFAEHLSAGCTYAAAWFRAVQDTQPRRRRDCAIAIAFGPTEAQARAHLQTVSLANRPARTVADACWWQTR